MYIWVCIYTDVCIYIYYIYISTYTYVYCIFFKRQSTNNNHCNPSSKSGGPRAADQESIYVAGLLSH